MGRITSKFPALKSAQQLPTVQATQVNANNIDIAGLKLAQEVRQENAIPTAPIPPTMRPEVVIQAQTQQVTSPEVKQKNNAPQVTATVVQVEQLKTEASPRVETQPASVQMVGEQNGNIPPVTTESFNGIVASQDFYELKTGDKLKVSRSIDKTDQLKKAGWIYGVLDNDKYERKEGHLKVTEEKLSAVLVSTATNGRLVLNSDGTFEYRPNQGFSGNDYFTYKISDGFKYSNTALVKINVVNYKPIAKNDEYTLIQDTVLKVLTDKSSNLDKLSTELGGKKVFGVLENDTDKNSNKLLAEVISSTKNGKLDFYRDGTFEYKPNPDFTGPDSFTYRAFDGIEYSETATAFLTIKRVNKPIASDDDYSVNMNDILTINKAFAGALARWIGKGPYGLLNNDLHENNKNLKVKIETLPTNGQLKSDADGTFKYQPATGFEGRDSFTYRACFEDLCSEQPGNVFITVQRITNFHDEI